MEDEIRNSIVTGEREANGRCVVCNRKVCKDNRFLCKEHHIEELQATFALIAKGALGATVALHNHLNSNKFS